MVSSGGLRSPLGTEECYRTATARKRYHDRTMRHASLKTKVGRTPWSAADALVGLLKKLTIPKSGSRGVRPTFVFITLGGPPAHGHSLAVAVRFVYISACLVPATPG